MVLTWKEAEQLPAPEPGIVWRAVKEQSAALILKDLPVGCYLIRPSVEENNVHLSYVHLDGTVRTMSICKTGDGWMSDNVENGRRTLWELLNRLDIFLNIQDSPQLVPGEQDSLRSRPLGQFFLEKHDFFGVVCYRHSFSGMNKPRRVLSLILSILLLLGTNLFIYSSLDASCYKIDHCHEGCVEAYGEDQCTPQDISVTVTDFSGSRITTYEGLYLFPKPMDDDGSWEFCSDVSNPIWDYSPVCLSLCKATSAKLLLSDNGIAWSGVNCTSDDTNTMANEDVLACEHVLTQTIRGAMDGGNAAVQFENCQDFAGRKGVPSIPLFFLKAFGIGLFLLLSDGIIQYLLRISQPMNLRTKKKRSKLFLSATGTIAGAVIFLFVVLALFLMVLGGMFIGTVWELWAFVSVGVLLSVFLRYFFFSPVKIVIWWLVVRYGGCWRWMSEEERMRKAAKGNSLHEKHRKRAARAPHSPAGSHIRRHERYSAASATSSVQSSPGVTREGLREGGLTSAHAHASAPALTFDEGQFHIYRMTSTDNVITSPVVNPHAHAHAHAHAQHSPGQHHQSGATRPHGRTGSSIRRNQADLTTREALDVEKMVREAREPKRVASRGNSQRRGSHVSRSPQRMHSDRVHIERLSSPRRREPSFDTFDEFEAHVSLNNGCCCTFAIIMAVLYGVVACLLLYFHGSGCAQTSPYRTFGLTLGLVGLVLAISSLVIFCSMYKARRRVADCCTTIVGVGCASSFCVVGSAFCVAFFLAYGDCVL